MNIENNIKESLTTRYTSKAFTPNAKINQEHYQLILEAANMAPTSFGLQPFKIIEVKDQETKDKILPIAFNQPQVNTCDSILIFAIETDLEISIQEYKSRIISLKRQDDEGAEGYMKYIQSFLSNMKTSGVSINDWSTKQAYIALGYASMTAALLGIETACMEGFIPAKIDELLSLKAKNLQSVVMLCVGVGAEDDANKTNPKVRKTLQELVIS
jgi:nitroreductase / dihydropteridine reductase